MKTEYAMGALAPPDAPGLSTWDFWVQGIFCKGRDQDHVGGIVAGDGNKAGWGEGEPEGEGEPDASTIPGRTIMSPATSTLPPSSALISTQ